MNTYDWNRLWRICPSNIISINPSFFGLRAELEEKERPEYVSFNNIFTNIENIKNEAIFNKNIMKSKYKGNLDNKAQFYLCKNKFSSEEDPETIRLLSFLKIEKINNNSIVGNIQSDHVGLFYLNENKNKINANDEFILSDTINNLKSLLCELSVFINND